MKLYVFRPFGHGQLTFFVFAENETTAKECVERELTEKSKLDIHHPDRITEYDYRGWGTDHYSTEIYEVGQVATNNND